MHPQGDKPRCHYVFQPQEQNEIKLMQGMLKGRKQHDLTQEKHFLFIKDFQNHGYKNETQS